MKEQSLFVQFPKLRLIVFIGAGLMATGVVALSVYRAVFSATITITAAPHVADITIDDRLVENRASQRVRPGVYTVRVNKLGFISEEQMIEVERGDNLQLTFALLPEDGNFEWYLNNPDDSFILDSVTGDRINEEMAQISRDFPILARLPHRTNFYELEFFALPTEEEPRIMFRLTIFEVPRYNLFATRERFEAYREESRIWLYAQGMSPDEYGIVAGNELID